MVTMTRMGAGRRKVCDRSGCQNHYIYHRSTANYCSTKCRVAVWRYKAQVATIKALLANGFFSRKLPYRYRTDSVKVLAIVGVRVYNRTGPDETLRRRVLTLHET